MHSYERTNMLYAHHYDSYWLPRDRMTITTINYTKWEP